MNNIYDSTATTISALIRVKRRRRRIDHGGCRRRQRNKYTHLLRTLCMATILTSTTGQVANRAAHEVGFDTDAKRILVDNCATASITNNIMDCATKPIQIKRKVKGIAGSYQPDIYETTIRWDIEDDDGKIHQITLPRSYYIPSTPTRLLSPQHWAQTARDNKPQPRGTRCVTYEDTIELIWDQGRHKRTIPIQRRGSNVGEFSTAAGYKEYAAFCPEQRSNKKTTVRSRQTTRHSLKTTTNRYTNDHRRRKTMTRKRLSQSTISTTKRMRDIFQAATHR